MPRVQEMRVARQGIAQELLAKSDSSLRSSPHLWMYPFLVAGLIVRVWHASGTYLHPDEALHYFMANKTSWALTYKASLTMLHPPLLILVLHAWRALGTSELVLRMPSIIAGVAFCWLTFRWLQLIFFERAAWIGFSLVLFLPSSIALGSEVRQYALLLAFSMAAAYLLELALAHNSARLMLLSGMCLWLAICSHYSAFLFAAVLGAYAVSRMVRHPPALKVIAAWEAAQIIAFGLGYFFYVTHIATLGQRYGAASTTQGWMGNSYLGNSYYVPGKINPLLFIFARTGGVFQHVFGQVVVGDVAFLLFVVGIVLLLRGGVASSLTRFQIGALLIFPFALNGAAALLRFYPYGGTRHSAFLIPFALAGVSFAISSALKSQLALGIFAALLIALLCNVFSSHRDSNMSREGQRSAQMKSAMNFIEQGPPAEPIFADYQTGLMLDYYLCQHQPVTMDHSVPGFLTYECSGHRVIATDWNTNIFTAQNFQKQLPVMATAFKLAEHSSVWIVQMGPPGTFAAGLVRTGLFASTSPDFGAYIHLFELPVERHLPPGRPTS